MDTQVINQPEAAVGWGTHRPHSGSTVARVSCALPGALVCVTSEPRSRDQQITWVFPSRLDFALKPLSAKVINTFTGAAGFPRSEGVLCLGGTGGDWLGRRGQRGEWSS